MGPRHRPPTTRVALASTMILALASSPRAVLHAQDPTPSPLVPAVSEAIAFALSPPVSSLPPEDSVLKFEDPDQNVKAVPNRAIRREIVGEGSSADEALHAPAVQPANPGLEPPGGGGTTLPFEGISNADNASAFGFRVSPPDTDGDVGPNHYVQQVNLLVRVFDKAGAPLTAPFKLSSLFAPLGGQCAAPDAGDPIVLYDPLADRWLLSQFAFASQTAAPYFQCIAVSQTPDPTGAYFLYAFVTAGNEFPDYPKIGVWPDGYYMMVHQFTNGGPFNGTGMYSFNRARMLAGDPTANYIYFNLNLAGHPEAIGGGLVADMDGLNPPPPGSPNIFAYFTATDFTDPANGIRLFNFHADFANPASSTFTERPESSYAAPIPVAAFSLVKPAGRRNVPQPSPAATVTTALDVINDRFMHRLQYRNNGSFESLVVSHTVGAPGSTVFGTFRPGVRYYELRNSGSGYAVAEQATFAPADGVSRWMGSAATDNRGNLAVGYSVSSGAAGGNVFPGIRYAGRLSTDPPGGLFQGEQTIVNGSGVQRDTSFNRWGDYSALSVDPADDCTFWFTSEYYTAASQASSTVGWLTRIGSFKFDECAPPAQGVLQGTVTNAATTAPISGALVQVSNGYSQVTSGSGGYSRNLPPGTYDVTASRFGYAPATATGVVISDGGTTTVNLALTPMAVVVTDAATLTAESFAPGNGAIDPGETVSVSFSLKNIGPGPTTNLAATLRPTGGVLAPSGPQSYGVIAPAGGTAARTFTFRADPSLGCGGTLITTLHLQDGVRDLGDVTFSFLLGTIPTLLAESFDSVVAPALPGGWTAANASGPLPLWVTSSSTPDTAPNAAFVDDPAVVSDKRLDSPPFLVASSGAQVTFRNNYNLEAGFDGGVLEISLDGGPFADIVAAGGSFVSGGYNRTISATFSNPIAGRQAWSASSGGYVTTKANLPAAAAGKTVQLRWRMGSDTTVAGTGWRIDGIVVTAPVACAFSIVPAGSTLLTESFSPVNGVIDPGEKVTVNLGLRNEGTSATSDLVAVLQPTGGVTSPGGAQAYGVLAAGGGTAAHPFEFRADAGLPCGAPLVATLRLFDGAVDLGTATFSFVLGVPRFALTTSFDDVAAPALPGGWSAVNASGPAPTWVGSSTSPDTPPNAAFVNDPAVVSDKRLDGPAFPVVTASAKLTFRNNYNLEAGFDGGVLEISLDGGPFADILTAGGTFVAGGYNRTIAATFSNPLAGRQAWSASSSGYITTTVNLPAAAAGKTVQLRWRMGSDNSVAGTGWSIDSLAVQDGYTCGRPCAITCPADISVMSEPDRCGASVTYPPPITSFCDAVTCSPASGSFYPVGTTTNNCTASTLGGDAAACSFHTTVSDAQGPTLGSATASPSVLWPPNHKMVDVGVSYAVADNCAASCVLSVASNEPINGQGDGDTAPDWIIVDAHLVQLRAERSGNGGGRVYTIGVTCSDAAGHSASRSVQVTVPHDRR